jgi:5-formyltetrahydrofolate cyclo-ligase
LHDHDAPPDPPRAAQKQALRQLLRSQRATLSPGADSVQARAASVAVAAHVDGILRWPRGGRLAVYAAVRGELDPRPLAELGRLRTSHIYYPRLAEDGIRADDSRADTQNSEPSRLTFHLVSDFSELAPGPLGIPAPRAEAETGRIDVYVVPGLGFDRRGGRIGFGRGFYDAALRADPAALRIGVGYDWQVVSAVPSEPHDEPLDLVVTPFGCIVTAARAPHPLCRGLFDKEELT